VVAALRSPDGQRLAFVTAERLGKDDKTTWLTEVQFGFIDLTTLETAGPLKLAGGQGELTIGFGKGGTPLLTTPGAVAAAGDGLAAGTYEIDTARTGLTQAASDSELVAERLIIRPDRVIRSDRPGPAAVTLADDRHSLKLGSGGVITSARLLADSSLAWSPDQRYFVYAGRLDGCAAQREERQAASPSDPAKPPPNELYLYEVETKAAARIDAAPSAFDSQWLSDSLLAYELGAGGKSSIALYDLTTRKKSLLPLHDGAGFAFLPTFSCAASVPPPPPPPPPPPAATP
jgi:hypothetical protein